MMVIIKFCVFNDYGDFETEIEIECSTWKLDKTLDGRIKDIFEIEN